MSDAVVVRAPGRVNLIGDHVDYLGGAVLPMAIQLGTTIRGSRGGDRVELRSDAEAESMDLPLRIEDPATTTPSWARYVAGVMAELGPTTGFVGSVASDLPIGAGLSSSAALEVAAALALGFDEDVVSLAQLAQRAEQRASGVQSGIMDQLVIAAATAGAALLIDCGSLRHEPVQWPTDLAVVVIESGESRTLAGSAYSTRRREAEDALRSVDDGPVAGWLDRIDPGAVEAIGDAVGRRRARHAVSENARVTSFAAAIEADDRPALGRLMAASHASLRDDYEVSTPTVDQLVERLTARPNVWGARMTGGGFGGCVVALTEPGALAEGWTVRPSAGASISVD